CRRSTEYRGAPATIEESSGHGSWRCVHWEFAPSRSSSRSHVNGARYATSVQARCERHDGATISQSLWEAREMEQRSLQDGIVTKRHQSKRVNSSLAAVLCFSFLVVAGSPASANQWSYPGDPGFVATSPAQLPAAIASWETLEYGNYTGVDPSTGGT